MYNGDENDSRRWYNIIIIVEIVESSGLWLGLLYNLNWIRRAFEKFLEWYRWTLGLWINLTDIVWLHGLDIKFWSDQEVLYDADLDVIENRSIISLL